ncbi:MAG: DUF2764 family protein [Rhabdochlamydiaceae bacterium]|nr:DUF2764 family protein [Candidatus Amphrikana amoebophyrae]
MKNYYFLANALPELLIDSKPVISYMDVMTLFQENLTESDLDQVKTLRLYYDILNIQRLMEEEAFDFRSNWSSNELKESLLNYENLPPFVFEFFEEFSDVSDRIDNFSKLMSCYFDMASKKTTVLADILQFEKELRLTLIGYRAHRLDLDLAHELRFEDLESDLIIDLLAKKDHSNFDFGPKYAQLNEMLETSLGNPLKEEKALNTFRFNFYSHYQVGHPFSLHFLLAFVMQLMIIEDFEGHDSMRGEQILNSIAQIGTP